jgi:SAM-dependent methyltransferase
MRTEIDWNHWLARWDTQQSGYLPDREARFTVMLDALDVLLGDTFTALDLACGPGSISQRILARFPNARCVAVDFDPVLLAIGQGALGTMDGRLCWIEADLDLAEWSKNFEEGRFDAILTTTALHWLPLDRLIGVYADLARILRPGGVFLNGDNIGFAPHMGTLQRVADSINEYRQKDAFDRQGIENWEQ